MDNSYIYTPEGICPGRLSFRLESGRVRDLSFLGGCNGNLKAISKIVDGMPAQDLIEKFSGITCGERPTSCADQLSRALRAALEDAGAKQ